MKEVVFKKSEELTLYELRNTAGVRLQVAAAGRLYGMWHGDVQLNQVLGNPMEGAMTRIYLRRRDREDAACMLIGPETAGTFRRGASCFEWSRTCGELTWTCRLRLHPEQPLWFWQVSLDNGGSEPVDIDVLYGQDLGLALPGALQINEAYICQYMDHQPVKTDAGYVVMSRQSLAQGDKHPWIIQGVLGGAKAYCTDAFQFFGPAYKQSNRPAALSQPALPSTRYQFEAAYVGLQSEPIRVEGGASAEVVFFAMSRADQPKASCSADAAVVGDIQQAWQELGAADVGALEPVSASATVFDQLDVLAGEALDPERMEKLFPGPWRHVERAGEALQSFFYGVDRHVVLPGKEIVAERQHGHVIKSGDSLLPDDPVLCSTAYMAGLFNAQVVLGNTSFNKLLSVMRNPLNIIKSSGQRIFVRAGDRWQLLGMPSAFEMGRNHCRWVYAVEDDLLTVRTWVSSEKPQLNMDIQVDGPPRELLVTHDLVLGVNERVSKGRMSVDPAQGIFTCYPAAEELQLSEFPDTRFFIRVAEPSAVDAMGGDELLHADGDARDYPCAVVRTKPVTSFELSMAGVQDIDEEADCLAGLSMDVDFDETIRAAEAQWDAMTGSLRLQAGDDQNVQRLDDILRWYVHNGMIHYVAPHGLEQYSGAAWGVRDICQGPVEMLLSVRALEPVAAIIERVFEHQFEDDGSWPQWFMFDRFSRIQQNDSHGDIIIWPLKAVCDYIEYTDSDELLGRPIPFTRRPEFTVTEQTYSLEQHIERLIEHIETHSVEGTDLLSYGDGDWNDSLQPADAAMKTRMVSGWTVALVYQVFRRYEKVCRRFQRDETADRVAAMCDKIRADYNRWLIREDVVSGFIFFEEDGADPRYLLHPSDETTGIHYRLLPMQRGVISEIFTPEQAEAHAGLIHEHLLFPDGARLMNKPPAYRGGEEKIFRRAESASNFGREIGLHYVHAHIRYVEAMAKLGRADDVLQGLLAVNPLGICDSVSNAQPRQANMYFSSSDAAFADRYQAADEFNRLYDGKVTVKGGWRLYSSGPGLYIYQVLGSMLGFREYFDQVVFDPVMPRSLDGLTLEQDYHGHRIKLVYHVSGNTFAPERIRINDNDVSGCTRLENPYRKGGLGLNRAAFLDRLTEDENLVEIIL